MKTQYCKIESTQIQHERSINNLDDKTEAITASLASVQSAEVENKQFKKTKHKRCYYFANIEQI
jgi:hypothetical protein